MAAFTTIAALTATAASTGMSFAQASKQRKMQQKAEKEADEAMARARKELDVNFYEGLAIQKEPYELEREALLSSGAQLVGAGAEADPRLLAAIGGRVQQLQQKGQRQIASAMGQELAGLEKLAASEEKARAQRLADLDLQEAAGAQLAARDAEEARAAATTQAMKGVGDIVGQAASLAPLFGANKTETFDPTDATLEQTQMVFNPELESMQRTLDPSGRISPGVRVPRANLIKPFTLDPFDIQIQAGFLNRQ